MKISTIEVMACSIEMSVLNAGTPSVMITLSDTGEDKTENEVMTTIKDTEQKTVVINARTAVIPSDVISLCRKLDSLRKSVLVCCLGSDRAPETLRKLKYVKFAMQLDVPTAKKANNINPKNLPLLKEEDEIIFKLDKEQSFIQVMTYMKGRLVTRPTIVFLSNNKQEYTAWLKISNGFVFKNRFINI